MTGDQSRHERAPLAVEVVPPPRLATSTPGGAVAPGGRQADLLDQITGALRTAAACGDLDTARALHAALARALGVAQPPEEASGARVVPLRGRGKRGAR